MRSRECLIGIDAQAATAAFVPSPSLQTMDDIFSSLSAMVKEREALLARTTIEKEMAEELIHAELEISQAMCRSDSMEQAASSALEIILEHTEFDSGAVYLANDKLKSFRLERHFNLSEGFLEQVQEFSMSSYQARKVQEGAPFFGTYDDFSKAIRITQRPERKVYNFAMLPLRSADKTIGCIALASHEPIDIDRNRQEALQTVASHVGESIGRIRVLHLLKEEKIRFWLLTEAVDEAVAILDGTSIICGNRACNELVACRGSIDGLELMDYVHPDDLEAFKAYLESETGERHNVRILTSERREITISLKSRHFHKINGYDNCVVLVAHEWHERKID